MYKARERFSITGNDDNLPKPGRSRSTTPREDRTLVRACLSNRKLTVPELCNSRETSGTNRSATTIRRRYQEVCLNGHKVVKKPILTPRHHRLRLDLAMAHQDRTWVDWSWVLMTDESKFNLFQRDGPVYVRRRPDEVLRPDCVVPTVKFHGGNVMMWGCMSDRGTGVCSKVSGRLNGLGYIDILRDCAMPSAHLLGYGNEFRYQDDGAPCHRVNIVKQWKLGHDVRCLNQPPQSPDLNPFENLWFDIKCALKRHNPRNLDLLEADIQEIRQKIVM